MLKRRNYTKQNSALSISKPLVNKTKQKYPHLEQLNPHSQQFKPTKKQRYQYMTINLSHSKANKQNQSINQRKSNTNSLIKLTHTNNNNPNNDNKLDVLNKKIKDIIDVNSKKNNSNNKLQYKIDLTKSNICHNPKTLNTNKQTIKNQSLLIQKTNFTNYNEKQDVLEKYNDNRIISQNKQNQLPHGHLYFIQNIKRKNHNTTQFYINIHTSILIFKQFLKLSLQSKPKKVEKSIPPQKQSNFYVDLYRKTIVFDMDETLIHTNQTVTPGHQLKVPFKVIQGRTSTGFVTVRPYAKQLLVKLSQHFDIIVFTAGNKCYADPILDHIDPNNVIIHRLYRQSCTFVGNQLFVKDLRILGRRLQNTVLVDNAPYSYLMQLSNGIPILNYFKGKQDNQLYYLQKYLMGLKDVQDVRQVNKEYFKLHQYVKYDLHEKLIQSLYSKRF